MIDNIDVRHEVDSGAGVSGVAYLKGIGLKLAGVQRFCQVKLGPHANRKLLGNSHLYCWSQQVGISLGSGTKHCMIGMCR